MEKDKVLTGACRYCGQVVTILNDADVSTQDQAHEYATLHCNCPQASRYQAEQKAKLEREAALNRAKDQIEKLCGGGSVGYGLIPIDEGNRDLMYSAAVLIYDDEIKDITIDINSCVKVKISKSTKGKLIVFRSDVAAFKQEA